MWPIFVCMTETLLYKNWNRCVSFKMMISSHVISIRERRQAEMKILSCIFPVFPNHQSKNRKTKSYVYSQLTLFFIFKEDM